MITRTLAGPCPCGTRHACRQRYLTGVLDPLLTSVLQETGPAGVTVPSAGASSLLRQTLEALGRENGRALMESHLRERTGVIDPATDGGLGGMDSEALARLHRAIESDLGVAVPEDLVQRASSLTALASGLIALVVDSAPGTYAEPRSAASEELSTE